MKIHTCPICCPSCRLQCWRRHGCYVRKGLHAPNGATALPVSIQRYRCLNPRCKRATFSILPPDVLPLCRFRWSELLSLGQSLAAGTGAYQLARYVWYVSPAVIARARTLLAAMQPWIEALYQELTDGKRAATLTTMVTRIIARIGRVALLERWYRHRYPLRGFPQNQVPHNLAL